MDTQNGPNPQKTSTQRCNNPRNHQRRTRCRMDRFCLLQRQTVPMAVGTMLLHPIVPILLIVLLTRIYRWIDIRSIVILEIIMISIWIFYTPVRCTDAFHFGVRFRLHLQVPLERAPL